MTTIIKQVLASRNMSQNKLSQLAMIPASNLNQIVNGKQGACPAWRKRIAEALRLPEEFLFPEGR